ncbi:MAG: DUF29 domain-containing protein [Xenococcaceae cyanobacterium]
MTAQSSKDLTTDNLYDRDYYLWLENTAKLLRTDRLSELDLSNLIEEIEDMGRSEKRAVRSNLTVLLMHLLKYKYQPEKRSESWLRTIVEHRRRLLILLTDSPSLNNYFQEIFNLSYQDARQDAAVETRLSIDTFPLELPFAPENVLNPNYLPEDC